MPPMRPLGEMILSYLKCFLFFQVLFKTFDFLCLVATLINHSKHLILSRYSSIVSKSTIKTLKQGMKSVQS